MSATRHADGSMVEIIGGTPFDPLLARYIRMNAPTAKVATVASAVADGVNAAQLDALLTLASGRPPRPAIAFDPIAKGRNGVVGASARLAPDVKWMGGLVAARTESLPASVTTGMTGHDLRSVVEHPCIPDLAITSARVVTTTTDTFLHIDTMHDQDGPA